MTDIALDFKEETASVNRLGESLRKLKIAADAANQSSLDKLRGAIAALGLGSREHLQQIAVDTRSILQKLQQEVKQTAVSNAKDITVSLAVEAAKQADIQATAIKSVVAEYKAAAASQKAIDKELHANRVASMQFEAAQRKMQIAESSAQAAVDASLHKNRIANSQFETAQLKLQEDARKAAAAEQAAIDASLHKNRVANSQFETAQLKLQEDARKAAAAEQAAVDASLHKNRIANSQFEAAQLKLQEDARKAAAVEQAAVDASLHKNRIANSQFETAQLKLQEDARKAAAAEQAAIDASLHKNRVANSQFETAQLKLQEDARKAAAAEQAAIDASLHKNRIANLQFEAAQQLQLAKTAQQQVAAAMNSSTAPYQLYNANTSRAGSVVNAPTNPIHPKAIADTNALSTATVSLTGSQRAMNDGLRGLVQSLGMYSSTMSAIIPMMAGMAVGAGLKHMLDQGRDLEYQMTFIAKLTDGAVISVDQFSKAMEGSQLTTKEGAAGLRALAQAGLSAEDALIALPDVMNLAVVGEMQLGAAALVATGIMHAFNLQLTDMPHIIDVMTKAAAISNTSVEGMATAMKTASVVSDQFGVSLEEVSSGLVVMAKRNIEGTSAGTAMKNFITNLASTTPIAAARMKQLGIEVYDAEGNLKKMAQIIPELATAFVGLNEKTKNEALKDLFNERGRRAAAALIKDVTLYGEVLGKLVNESKGFAANVVSGLDHTITGQLKATANALSLTFDEAFAHTSNSWSNLIAQFTDAASSSDLRLFIEDAAKAVITLVDNLGKVAIAAGAVALAVVAWQTYSAAVVAAEAASVAAGLTVARTAVTLEAQAAAAAAAASATGVFSAVLARIAWPVAIVTALWVAFESLAGQVDSAKEAQKRYAREGQDTISKLDALIAKTNEESAALRLQTKENISLAEAVRRVRREKGLSASGEDQGQEEVRKTAKKLAEASAAADKSFFPKNSLIFKMSDVGKEYKSALDAYLAAAAASAEMAKQAPAIALKQQEADLSLGVKAIRTATQDNAEILREKIVEGQNYLAELKKTTPKDPKIGRLESTIADLQRLDKGLALVGETVANNIKITADGALSPETLQTLKETQGLAKGAAKELDKLFISKDKPESVFGANGRAPHVEKVKLETSNIVEELSKRNKLVLEADKASAANRKAILDAEFAANLIDRSSYEAEVEHLRAKADAAAIAELTRQQEVRVDAYIDAEKDIQKAQEKFNSLNASNAKAIEANDEHIAAVRANNANKYITDYLTTVNAISTIQQKASTDVRLAEIKHQEALQKIKQEGLDWEASEIDLKTKNAKAATNASVVRRAISPLQAAVLTAENSEFERLTANANKYDAEIKKLRESVIAYNEVQSVGTDLSSESADLDDRRSKANTKTIAQLTELVDRKNKLAAGIPIELKFKGTEATELFISTEAVRIREGLTDAIMGAGKDGGAGLRNFLEAELLTKPFRMVVQATLEPIAQSLANSLWGGAGGGLASNGGVGGSIVNSMLGAVIGKGATMSSLGSAFGAGFSSTLAGNGLFSGAGAGTAATGGAAGSGVAGAIGSAAPYIIAAAVAAGVLQRAQGSVTAAGTFVYGHNSATGFKTGGRADFIQEGGIGGGGTTPNSSWFDPGAATSKYMSAMGDLVTNSVKGWAEAVGLSAEAVNGYTETVQAAIGNGMSKAEERQSIDKAMAGYGDAMIQALYGEMLAPLMKKQGEAASATLQRLGTDLAGVNAILEKLGGGALEKSLAGAQVAEDFITAAGTLENLQAVSGQYYDSLYSAQEKALGATKDLDKAFADLGVTTPKSAAELRKLVESQDLSTAAGRSMAVSLMSLAPAFQQVAQSAVDARTAMLSDVGINSGDISGTIKKALIEGNLKTAGGEISEKIMTGIQDALYGRMADQITNSFTNEMLAPLLEAMQKGKSLPEALAAVDWTQVKSKFQQTVDDVSAIFNNSQVTSGIGSLKTAIQDLFSTASYSVPKGWVLTKTETTTQAATGGLITGPGTGTSDSIPAMLSNGEFVIKASSASKLGTGFLNALNAGKLPAQRANGGYVFDPLTGTRVIDAEFGYTPAYDDVRRSVPGMANFTDNEISWWQSNQTNFTAPASQTAGSDRAKTAEDLASTYETLATDAAQTYIDVLRAMGEVYSANVLALNKATEGFDELHVSMYREVEAGKQLVTLRETLVQAQRDYASSEVELLKAKGNGAGAAALQRSLDLADVNAKKTAAELRLLEAGLSENEKAYQSAIIATANATVAQYDLTKAREAEISAAGRLLSATKDVASSRVKLLQAGGSEGEAAANQRAIDLADTFDSLNAASSRLATAGLSETERSVLLNTVAADLQTVAQYDLGKALETTTEHVTAAVSGLKNLQDSFETLNVSALTALGDKSGAGAAQKAIALKSVNEAAATAQTLLNSGTVTDADVKAGLELTVNTAKLADAQYDLNEAITAGIAGLTGIKGALEGFQKTGDDLVIQKTRLTGNDDGADVLQRSSDLKDVFKGIAEATATLESDGITPLQRSIAEATVTTGKAAVAQYDRNKSLTDEIEILGRYKSAQAEANSTNIELLKVTGQTAKAAGLELASATKGFNDTQIATVRQTNATKGLIAAYGNLSNTENMVTNSRIGLLKAKGDTAGAAALQRELDIAPYVTAIAAATLKLASATTESEKDTLRLTIARNEESISNYDLSKSLDLEAQAANAAQAAAEALASSYRDLQDQIAQANVELLKASGNAQEAEEAAMALALREHEGDAYYASLYQELITIQKLTEARQELTSLEETAVQNQLKLMRAQGRGILANDLEREAFLRRATLPAAQAQKALNESAMSFGTFAASRGVGVSPVQEQLLTAYGVTGERGYASGLDDQATQWQIANAKALTQGGFGSVLSQEQLDTVVAFANSRKSANQTNLLQKVVNTQAEIVAAYDRNRALEAELKLMDLQDEAYKANLSAQKSLEDAQKAYADVLKSTINTMKDFLKSLDGAATPLQSLSQARLEFKALSVKAASGDTSVYKDLTPAAKTLLDLSKGYSGSLQEYRRDEARVRAVLNSIISVNQSELDKLPQEIAKASDPTKEAWLKLQEATAKEAESSWMLTALSVDSAASKQRLREAEDTLTERFYETVLLLEEANKQPLLAAFNAALETKVDDSTLPEYTAFDLGDIWGTKIADVLPAARMTNDDLNRLVAEKFPGLLKSDIVVPLTTDVLTGLIRGVLPERLTATNIASVADTARLINDKLPTIGLENLVSSTADVSGLVSTRIDTVLPSNFAGSSFNAAGMMQTAINSVVATLQAVAPPPVITPPPVVTPPPAAVTDPRAVPNTHPDYLAGLYGKGATFGNTFEQNVANLRDVAGIAKAQGFHLGDLQAAFNQIHGASGSSNWGKFWAATGLPSFAVGTNYVPQDMIAQIHKGEAIIPAPFNPTNYSKDSDNAALVTEIKALRAEVENLRRSTEAGQNAIAANTRKTAQVLVKFDTDGLPATQT